MGIVYYAFNLINKKGYVGQTRQTLEERIKTHYRSLNDGTYEIW